jgi:hypothetical protein
MVATKCMTTRPRLPKFGEFSLASFTIASPRR